MIPGTLQQKNNFFVMCFFCVVLALSLHACVGGEKCAFSERGLSYKPHSRIFCCSRSMIDQSRIAVGYTIIISTSCYSILTDMPLFATVVSFSAPFDNKNVKMYHTRRRMHENVPRRIHEQLLYKKHSHTHMYTCAKLGREVERRVLLRGDGCAALRRLAERVGDVRDGL